MLERARLAVLRCAYIPGRPFARPPQPGVALRGALGKALFDIACYEKPRCQTVDKGKSSIVCRFKESCIYHRIFASEAPSYIVSPLGTEGASHSRVYPLSFHLTLLGGALAHAPLVLRALGSAARQFRARFVAESLAHYGDTRPSLVYEGRGEIGELKVISVGDILERATPLQGDGLTLHLLTPTFLSSARGGEKARAVKDPDFGLVWSVLNRRVKRLAALEGEHFVLPSGLLKAASQVETNARLDSILSRRYSRRQQQEVWLGGVTGRLDLSGVAPELGRYLHLAEYLHLGKNTVYGCGKVRVEGMSETG